jgi:hypothetical protein
MSDSLFVIIIAVVTFGIARIFWESFKALFAETPAQAKIREENEQKLLKQQEENKKQQEENKKQQEEKLYNDLRTMPIRELLSQLSNESVKKLSLKEKVIYDRIEEIEQFHKQLSIERLTSLYDICKRNLPTRCAIRRVLFTIVAKVISERIQDNSEEKIYFYVKTNQQDKLLSLFLKKIQNNKQFNEANNSFYIVE